MGILSRINRLHIAALGAVIVIAVAVAFVMSFLQPTNQKIQGLISEQQQQEATWQKLPASIAALGQAQTRLVAAKAEADAFMARMPKINISDAFDNMFEMHRYLRFAIGPPLWHYFVVNHLNVSSMSVPAASFQPQTVPAMFTFNWPITVTAKSFPAILNVLARFKYKDMPFPGFISGVQISGTSPNLSVNLGTISVFVFTPVAFGAAPATGGGPGSGGAPAVGAPGGG